MSIEEVKEKIVDEIASCYVRKGICMVYLLRMKRSLQSKISSIKRVLPYEDF